MSINKNPAIGENPEGRQDHSEDRVKVQKSCMDSDNT